MRWNPTVALISVLTSAIVACEPRDQAPVDSETPVWAAPVVASADVIDIVSIVDIDESSGVVLVSPSVFWEPDGFLVADSREARVALYDPNGKLQWVSGRKGQGPGEYRSAVEVLRLASGNVLAADRSYKFVEISASGDSIIQTISTPFYHVESFLPLSDSTFLVTSTPTDTTNRAVAAVWNMNRDSVTHTFFEPTHPSQIVAQTAGWTVADVRGDTIALMFAPKDTIFLFDLSGHPLGTVPLNSSRFRPAAPPPPDAVRDPQARMEWVSSFDLVSGVHLLKDGGYLVSYRSMTETGTRHHYVRLASDGAPQWEVRDMSRLLAVSEDDQLLMVDPDALVPNRWLIGRM